MQQYPKWKYAIGQAVMVDNAEAEADLKGEWFDLPEHLEAHLVQKARKIDEDLRAKRAARAEDEALDKQIADLKNELGEELPDIETLRKTAAELGLEVHPRSGAKKIAEQIKAAIEAKGE